MKSKLPVTLGIFIVAFTTFSFIERPSPIGFQANESDSTKGYLYLYGEYIYNRENCGSCHTLKINEDKTKISLDGIAGKYSPSWHYFHLENPEAIMSNSKMPSFYYLTEQYILKDSLEKHLGTVSDYGWKKLNVESRELELQLLDERAEVKPKAEIIALIHFINNLPFSDEYKKIRIKEDEEWQREKIAIDNHWANSSGLIFSTINDNSSIARGSWIFKLNCVSCHGRNGEGGIGPNLTDKYWLHGSSDSSLIITLLEGVTGKGMKSWKYDFSPKQIGQLIAFLKSLRGSNPANPKAAQGKRM